MTSATGKTPPDYQTLDGKDSEKHTAPKDEEEKEKKAKPAMIKISRLFKYSSVSDKAMFYLGALCAFIAGVCAPLYALVLGIMFEIFNPHMPTEEKTELVKRAIYISIAVAIAQAVFGCLSYALMQIAAEKLSFTLRAKYLDSLMR